MDKTSLLKRLDPVLDDFDRNKTFGTIEIVFRFGRASALRVLKTEKIQNEREKTHYEPSYENR